MRLNINLFSFGSNLKRATKSLSLNFKKAYISIRSLGKYSKLLILLGLAIGFLFDLVSGNSLLLRILFLFLLPLIYRLLRIQPIYANGSEENNNSVKIEKDKNNILLSVDNKGQLPEVNVNVNHSVEGSTIMSEGLKIVGIGLEKIAPAATGLAVGTAIVKGIQVMPGTPSQKLIAGVSTGVIASTTILASQYMHQMNKPVNLPDVPKSPSESKFLDNFKESKILGINFDSIMDYFNSFSPMEGLLICIFIYAIISLLLTILCLFNFLISLINLENKPFIEKTPRLKKVILFFFKTNKTMICFFLFLISFCLISICFISLYLLGSI